MTIDLIEIGFCSSAHGIKGGFTLNLYSGDDSVLQQGMTVRLFPHDHRSKLPAEGKDVVVTAITYGNKVIAFLDGITDRNIVDSYLPFSIKLDRACLPAPDEDEFYIIDLIDADVIDQSSGEKIGILKDIYDNGVQDIFVISTYDHGSIEVLNIPTFVHDIDVENKRVVITMPEVLSERE